MFLRGTRRRRVLHIDLSHARVYNTHTTRVGSWGGSDRSDPMSCHPSCVTLTRYLVQSWRYMYCFLSLLSGASDSIRKKHNGKSFQFRVSLNEEFLFRSFWRRNGAAVFRHLDRTTSQCFGCIRLFTCTAADTFFVGSRSRAVRWACLASTSDGLAREVR